MLVFFFGRTRPRPYTAIAEDAVRILTCDTGRPENEDMRLPAWMVVPAR
jgi:hypothetical protein